MRGGTSNETVAIEGKDEARAAEGRSCPAAVQEVQWKQEGSDSGQRTRAIGTKNGNWKKLRPLRRTSRRQWPHLREMCCKLRNTARALPCAASGAQEFQMSLAPPILYPLYLVSLLFGFRNVSSGRTVALLVAQDSRSGQGPGSWQGSELRFCWSPQLQCPSAVAKPLSEALGILLKHLLL